MNEKMYQKLAAMVAEKLRRSHAEQARWSHTIHSDVACLSESSIYNHTTIKILYIYVFIFIHKCLLRIDTGRGQRRKA